MHRRWDTKRLLLETAQNTTSRLVYAWIRRHIAHVHMYTNMTETALICFRKIWTDLTVNRFNRFPRSRWSLRYFFSNCRSNMEWTEDHDLCLSQEILSQEPFKAKKGSIARRKIWDQIANNLNSLEIPRFRVSKRSVSTAGVMSKKLWKK